MENPIESVDRVIRQRRTVKVFADDPVAEGLDRHMVEELVATAGWAPVSLSRRPRPPQGQCPQCPGTMAILLIG